MFNWLQHLFTLRAFQRENAELTAKVRQLELEVNEYKNVVAIKDEEIRGLKNDLSKLIESHKKPPLDFTKSAAQGMSY